MYTTKTEIANFLKISRSSFWRLTKDFYCQFSESFKNRKLISQSEARKLMEFIGVENNTIENFFNQKLL